MTRILLVRHGAVELLGRVLYGRMPGVHLSEEGRRQCHTLSNAITSRYRVDEVVSSPLERARETAEIISNGYDTPLLVDEGLLELDYGEWMGRPFDELIGSDAWHRYNAVRSTAAPPGGEFMMQVQSRAWAALERIVVRHPKRGMEERTVVVVTHGDVIRAVLVLLLGMPLDHIHRLEIAPASLSEVRLHGGYPRVISTNQIYS